MKAHSNVEVFCVEFGIPHSLSWVRLVGGRPELALSRSKWWIVSPSSHIPRWCSVVEVDVLPASHLMSLPSLGYSAWLSYHELRGCHQSRGCTSTCNSQDLVQQTSPTSQPARSHTQPHPLSWVGGVVLNVHDISPVSWTVLVSMGMQVVFARLAYRVFSSTPKRGTWPASRET